MFSALTIRFFTKLTVWYFETYNLCCSNEKSNVGGNADAGRGGRLVPAPAPGGSGIVDGGAAGIDEVGGLGIFKAVSCKS